MKEGAILTGLVEIKRTTRKYCEQLYINKVDNLGKKGTLLKKKKKIPTQEIEILNTCNS